MAAASTEADAKELQSVKARAVAKIRELQDQVKSLTAQLAEAEATAADLDRRENALSEREKAVELREAACQQKLQQEPQGAQSGDPAECAWHSELLHGLREIRTNLTRRGE